MMQSTGDTNYLFSRIHGYCAAMKSGEITQEQISEFETLICNNPIACEHYIWYMAVTSDLRGFSGQTILESDEEIQIAKTFSKATISREGFSPAAIVQLTELSSSPNTTTPPFVTTILHTPVIYLSTGWPVAYLIATVIFAIGTLIGAFTYVSQPGNMVREAPLVAKDHVANPSKKEFVGQITAMVDCTWADSSKPRVSEHVAMGQRYSLVSGLVEITYNTEAKILLQGPVTFDVNSENGGFLSIGKLTGKMETDTAKGFAVRTPTAIVTDLGTEFGVEVSKSGETVSRVFRGSVEVHAAPASGTSAGRALVLHENEAVCVSRNATNGQTSTITRTTIEPTRFTRAVPKVESQERPASDAYAEYVMSLKPAVYYRMEPSQKSDGPWTLYDFAAGGHHGVLHCDKAFLAPPYLDGRYGKSLMFRGPAVMDHAIVPDYPKSTDGRLTVSAWVKVLVHPASWAIVASNWGDQKYRGQFYFGLYGADGDLAANVTQSDGRIVAIREGASHPLPLGDWQHVALVADGSTFRLYRNGINVVSAPCTGVESQTPVAALGIGCETNDAGTDVAAHDAPSYWSGRIDELAIFNRALSAAEIKRLYEGDTAQ